MYYLGGCVSSVRSGARGGGGEVLDELKPSPLFMVYTVLGELHVSYDV